jgi:hypothetical protein
MKSLAHLVGVFESASFGRAALAAALVSMTPVLAGCAEDDYGREPAYPQAIGYSVPPSQPPVAQTAPAQVAPPPAPVAPPAEDDEEDDGAAAAGGPVQPAQTYGEDDQYADTDPSALSDFRSTLDPYGSWREDPNYGTVWVPSGSVVGSDFVPYQTAGHWVYDDDYVWVSDYSWGWAPFHYGRWVYAGGYGWEWIPGRTYAGAWVSWRYGWGDWGYVGWAPLGPTWGWFGGYAVGYGFVVREPYVFCGTGELFAPNVGARVVAGGAVATVAAHTQPWTGATPSVGGRVAAHPTVGGPPPSAINIPASNIAHGAATQRSVAQARAFARPSTAMTLGARAPVAAATTAHVGGRMPAYGSPNASHFGGKLGYGFRGSALNQGHTYAPSTSGLYYSHGRYGPAYGSPGRSFSGGSAGYSGAGRSFYGSPYTGGSRPSFGSGFSHGVAPHQAAHPSSGHSSGGSSSEGGYSVGHHGGGGGFHGGGSFGGGSFGGFHGGGGGGHGGGGRR